MEQLTVKLTSEKFLSQYSLGSIRPGRRRKQANYAHSVPECAFLYASALIGNSIALNLHSVSCGQKGGQS